MKILGSPPDGQDEFSQRGELAVTPTTPCHECGYPSKTLRKGWGLDICEDCEEKYRKSESEDGGPFRVIVWQFTSAISGQLITREYLRGDLEEAKRLAKTWQGKVMNAFNHEIYNYTKKLKSWELEI